MEETQNWGGGEKYYVPISVLLSNLDIVIWLLTCFLICKMSVESGVGKSNSWETWWALSARWSRFLSLHISHVIACILAVGWKQHFTSVVILQETSSPQSNMRKMPDKPATEGHSTKYLTSIPQSCPGLQEQVRATVTNHMRARRCAG